MSDLRAELRAAAEAATPGPWRNFRTRDGSWGVWQPDKPTTETKVVAPRLLPEADAAFIALANPTTVLGLLDDLDVAEQTIDACGCERRKHIIDLIERSSLGTEEAKAARESVPREVGMAITRAAEYLRRAEAAEAAVARVLALADEMDAEFGPRHAVAADGWPNVYAHRIRAALEPEGTP